MLLGGSVAMVEQGVWAQRPPEICSNLNHPLILCSDTDHPAVNCSPPPVFHFM